jgi:hypothetical protein
LHLVGALALSEELHRQRALGDGRPTRDVNLSSETRPVEEQRDVRIGLDLLRLAAPERRGDDQRLLLYALE